MRRAPPQGGVATHTLDGALHTASGLTTDHVLKATAAATFAFGAAPAPPAHVLDGALHTITGKTDGQALHATGAAAFGFENNYATLTFVIDGGGSVITTGEKGHIVADVSGTVDQWTVLGDQSGSIVVDVWKDTYANFPPTVADTMPNTGTKPTLSTAQKGQGDASDWTTTTITAGDVLAFKVDSVATVTRVTVTLRLRRSS